MQILKFYGMVLLTIVFCVNFTACSEDEEYEMLGMAASTPKPSTLIWDDGRFYKMFYDNQQRLYKVETYSELGFLDEIANIEYNDNTIVVTATPLNSNYELSIVDVCTLNSEGLIVNVVTTTFVDGDKSSTSTEQYAYNEEQQLIGIDNGYNKEILKWENGNLVTAKYSDGSYKRSVTYQYTSIPSSKGFALFLDDVLIDVFGDVDYLNLLANCGCFGKVPQNLLASITYSSEDFNTEHTTTYNLSYEFGDNGYVTEIISITEDDEPYSIKLKWN